MFELKTTKIDVVQICFGISYISDKRTFDLMNLYIWSFNYRNNLNIFIIL